MGFQAATSVYQARNARFVKQGGEEGIVLYTSLGEGGPPSEEFNRQQEMVGRFSWKKRAKDGVWECYMHEGIRGAGAVYS